MSQPANIVSPDTAATGIFPSQTLRGLVADGAVTATSPITDDLIQPASIDLRLGDFAWRVQASFLPGPDATVEDKVRAFLADVDAAVKQVLSYSHKEAA